MARTRFLYEERLAQKGANKPCAACGGTEWRSGDLLAYLLAIDRSGDMPILEQGGEVVPMICGNCGFVRLHALDVLNSE